MHDRKVCCGFDPGCDDGVAFIYVNREKIDMSDIPEAGEDWFKQARLILPPAPKARLPVADFVFLGPDANQTLYRSVTETDALYILDQDAEGYPQWQRVDTRPAGLAAYLANLGDA